MTQQATGASVRTQTQNPTQVVEKKHRKSKGETAAGEAIATKRMVEKLISETPMIGEDGKKIVQRLQVVIDKIALMDSRWKADFKWSFDYLDAMTGGRITKFIRDLPDEQPDGAPHQDNVAAKARLRRCGLERI